MLSRRLVATAAAVVAGIPVLLAQPTPANSQQVSCGHGEIATVVAGIRTCIASVSGTVLPAGQPQRIELRSTSGGSTVTRCTRPWGDDDTPGAAGPRTVPCHLDARGWYSRTWDCHFNVARQGTEVDPGNPPPGYDQDDPPGGILYRASCYPPTGNEYELGPHWIPGDPPLWAGSSLVVLPAPPDGFDGTDSQLANLWVAAVNELELRGPVINTAPPLPSRGLVGLRTWLWTDDDDPRVWGERQAVADARPDGLDEWVEVHAEPRHIDWSMGEPGREPARCDHPGEPYRPGLQEHHPDCGFTYQRASRHQPGGTYEITAVTTWQLRWWVNSDPDGPPDGELELPVGSTAPYRVEEIQVLVGSNG